MLRARASGQSAVKKPRVFAAHVVTPARAHRRQESRRYSTCRVPCRRDIDDINGVLAKLIARSTAVIVVRRDKPTRGEAFQR